MINAIPIVLMILALICVGVSTWLTLGWLADKYDAYRTNNWKGWR